MLAAIAIPEQLATARLAGFPPEAGLYAFIAGSIAFAIFGSNPYISVGADSTIAPIFAGTLTALVATQTMHYAPLASFLALAVGLALIVAGIAKAGWIADLLSIPVTVGFLAAISVHIIVGQLPVLLGVGDGSGGLIFRFWHVVQELGSTNVLDLVVGVSVLAITLVASKINKRIPGALIGIAGAALAGVAFAFERHGVAMLGALPARLPTFQVPTVPSVTDLAALAPLTLVVAAVCIMQTAVVGRAFPARLGVDEDVSKDFLAVGAGSVLSGLIGSFAVDSSPPRTAIVKDAGAASQLAAIVAVAVIAVLILFAAPLLAYVPQAALAGILVYIALHIFRLGDMRRIAAGSRREFTLMVAGALLVILLPIQTGMLLAIILSLAHGIQLMMRPAAGELLRVPGSNVWWPASDETSGERVPGVLVFAPAAPINFTNARFIHDTLFAEIARAASPVRLVVIECSGVTDFDYTGSQSLQDTILELRGKGIDVAMARVIVTHAQFAAKNSGLDAALGADHVFKRVSDAIKALGDGPSTGSVLRQAQDDKGAGSR